MSQTLKIILLVLLPITCGLLFRPAYGVTPSVNDESRIKLVVIDPGHGGKDFGAIYNNFKEKDIVLDIALKLGKYITNRFPQTNVMYTRSTDVFIPLHQRANLANKNNADLFISIHVNYVNSSRVHGTETFVLGQHRSDDNLEVAKKENAVILLENDYTTRYEGFDPNSPESYIMFELVQDEYLEQSVELASAIQQEFKTTARLVDRSVKQAGFLVLRQTTMPSVLVEAGFISNATERNFIVSEKGKISLATSIFNAFKIYKKKVENQSSFNLVTDNRVEVKPADDKEELSSIGEKLVPVNSSDDIYFSVQVAALSKQLDTKPENFSGEKHIFKLNSGNIYRYFSGKFDVYEKALEEKQRLQTKFGGAFVVAIEDGKLISVKKAMRKM